MKHLVYIYATAHYGIATQDGSVIRELHCGDCLRVKVDHKWYDVRIEHRASGWYFVGLIGHAEDYEGFLVETYTPELQPL